jgi:Fe-S oxidoreductase
MHGDVIADGWRDEHVKESLDLCLACKGCKSDCPVSVDMATYKAEFLAHYYEDRLRPRQAHAMGLIADWARIASRTPSFANFVTHAPALGNFAKFAAGISQRREIPRFARQTFRSWFEQRAHRNGNGAADVLLWPDTFNNYFLPQTARAATAVLESAGCHLDIPKHVLCCGRPLHDYGMLPQAKRRLEETLEVLGPEIDAGTPIVFLEPSCAAVFRDEMLGLLPNNNRAKRLSQQTFLFDGYLRKIDYHAPVLNRRALVHGHCHQKALMGLKPTEDILSSMRVKAEVLDSGCCGMAGSFGYESGHYDVSMKVGEHALLPKVRSTPKDRLIIASGFSCREQIQQGSDRQAVHFAEVVAMALAQQAPVAATGAKRSPIAWKRRTFAAAAAVVAFMAAVFVRQR